MLIKKEYKFYTGHRNQEIEGKCRNLHGHQYLLSVYFEVLRRGSVSTLFSEFDDVIEPWIKENLDHRFFLDLNDSLAITFSEHKQKYGEDLGLCLLPFPSSVENVCLFIFYNLVERYKFNINRIELKETSSSTIMYNFEDFELDMESVLGNKIDCFYLGCAEILQS